MKDRQTCSRSHPLLSSTFIKPLLTSDEIGIPVDFLRVAKEKLVSRASETRVIDGWASLVEISCMPASPASQDGNRYPKISRFSGIRCTCTVTSVITPSRPSEPKIISRTLGPVEEWPYDEHLAWHDSPEASGDVSDVAVLVRLHARGPGCHPAAERAVGEAVREVTESPAVLAQLPLDVWTQRSSLNRRQPGVVIDLEHTIEPAQINRDHRPGLIRRRFEAAGDVAATAERDQHGVGSDHPINDQLHLRLVARIDDHVRDPRDVAGAQPHQISQALAIGLHDPIKVIRVDVVEADGVGQLSQELVADPRGGIGRSSSFSGGVGGVFRSR